MRARSQPVGGRHPGDPRTRRSIRSGAGPDAVSGVGSRDGACDEFSGWLGEAHGHVLAPSRWSEPGRGGTRRQRETLKSLGLRKIRQSVVREDSASVRGMIAKVAHLVTVEEA